MAKQVFISDDGKKFDTLEAAELHDAMKKNEATFRGFLSTLGDKRISRKKLHLLQGWESYRMNSPEITA